MLAINILLLLAAAQDDSFVPGLQAFRNGDYAAAETRFSQSSDSRAKTFLALTYAATGRCKQAEPVLETAAGSLEITKLAGLALAQCRIAASDFDRAALVLAKLRAAYPSDADVLYLSARLQMRQWNDTMYQLYRKAPGSFRVNQISGEVLETQGRFTEAAAEYRKAIEKSPKTIGLHYRLARVLLMESHGPANLDTALREFQAELAINPNDPAAHYQIAQILLLRGKPADADASLKRALSLDPTFVEPMIALGKLRTEQKNFPEAIALLRHAIELNPANEGAHYNLMMAYRNSGDMESARRQKAKLDELQKAPEGEFTEFLKKLGETAPKK